MMSKAQHFLTYAGACVVMLTLLQPLLAQAPQKVTPSFGTVFEGISTVTTDADRMKTYVTLMAKQAGKPLTAAFVVQYATPAPWSAESHGEATVIFNEVSLRVSFAKGGWLFKSESYGGAPPTDEVAYSVIGIARYWWKEDAMHFYPSSHSDFVKLVESGMTSKAGPLDIPPPRNYSKCDCAGGAGSQSCTCAGVCQVQCYPPYEACCSKTKCWCCNP